MPRWRASSPRSRPNARGAKPTAREMRPKQTCSITSSEFETQALQDRLYEPHGVREASWISLSGCHPNRVQASETKSWDRVDKSIFLLGGFALENAIKAFLVYENPECGC